MIEAHAHDGTPRERRNLRVLLADDSVGTRLNLSIALKAFDPSVEIIETDNGRETTDHLIKDDPDIAFVNVQLPDLSGAEAVAFAKMRGARPTTFLMSNLVIPKWVELATELDAYEFLKKPFDPEHVVELLASVCRMRQPTRLLLVDDSQTARSLVRRVLTSCRFRLDVDETDTGLHALKLLTLANYDVALLDFNMDGMDGLETACQAREAAPDTALIMMSGSDNSSLAPAAKVFGVTAFVKKPFYARDIDLALHKAFDLRRPYLLNTVTSAAEPRPRLLSVR